MPVSGMNMAVFLCCQWTCYVEMCACRINFKNTALFQRRRVHPSQPDYVEIAEAHAMRSDDFCSPAICGISVLGYVRRELARITTLQ